MRRMISLRKVLLIILSLFFISHTSGAEFRSEGSKNILVLFSLVPSTPAYRIMLDGIRQKLTDEFGEGYSLHTEYLETERYPKGNYPKERFDIYNQKYSDIRLDMLICVGTNILPVIKQYASSKLLQLPALSIDYDFASFGYRNDLSLNDKTTEFPIKVDPVGTISSALALFPQTKSVYVISGVSTSDKLFLSITKEAVKQIKGDRIFSFLSDISMDDVLKYVRHLPANSIILISLFNVDSKLVPYYNPESIRLISKVANVPVFAYSDMGLGDGSVGGYLISFKKISRKMGEAAVKIIHGTDPNSIKMTNNDVYEYIYDWRELERWNVADPDNLPKGSIILYKEKSFFGKYKLIIISAVVFLVLQTLLIVNLVLMIRRQRKMTIRLKEAENKYRELIHEDRIQRIGQLTATLAHELNQPLTAILSTAQAGIRFINSNNLDPVLLKEIFQNIVEDDKRTAAILSSIRRMMKIEKREKGKVDLNSLVEEVITIYRSEANEHKIRMDVRLLNEHIYVLGDRIQIQQVIMNFIVNARQAMDTSRDENKTMIISEFIQQDDVIISVRDHGEGIDESLKVNIFKPFVSSKKEGFGVGLAISRSIIEDHQGKIWAESMPDGGAEFSFSLKIYSNEQ